MCNTQWLTTENVQLFKTVWGGHPTPNYSYSFLCNTSDLPLSVSLVRSKVWQGIYHWQIMWEKIESTAWTCHVWQSEVMCFCFCAGNGTEASCFNVIKSMAGSSIVFFFDRKWSQPRGRGSSVAETSSSPPGSNTSSRFLLAEKLAISQKLKKTRNTLLLKITAWQKRSAEFLSMSMILYVLRLTCFNFLCFSIYFRFCVIF